ncbi:MAG: TetR/AcrR family transcriptional regulator C-terminal domain-containing protein [Propionibacteriales bacterium]|nr:TetR/AcrR family transcriptional regulator C-terminal domain-containing protein [Propionibacteriales bacterium]
MTAPEPGSTPTPIWNVATPRARSGRALDRERITTTAIGLADAEGLEAVTMRRLAAELGSSPMSLYRHVPGGKVDLTDLMHDALMGEHDLAGIPSGDVAADLGRLGTERRTAAHRHPWSIQPTARPMLGPYGIRRLDTALSIFDERVTPERRGWAIGLLDAYVSGAVGQELAQHNEELRSGLSAEDWQHAVAPYMTQMLATGDYPHLADYTASAPAIDLDQQFADGLGAVIAGILAAIDS